LNLAPLSFRRRGAGGEVVKTQAMSQMHQPSTAAVVASLLVAGGALPASAAAPAATPANPGGYTLKVDKTEKRGTWEGWGCSFAWWAHAVGGKNYQDLYADLFFTDKTVPFLDKQLPGLGMNIIRYNIGGGGRRETYDNAVERVPDILPWSRDIDGYWLNWADKDPASKSWDWTRDANQRAMMGAAIQRGVNLVEFFSNAPMWWMTTTKSSAGGQLQAHNRRDFALYLATVTKYAQGHWGVRVNYVEPFNEPSAGWWNYPKNQEGCNIGRAEQKEILGFLREELDRRGLQKVAITASDENSMKAARETHEYFKSQSVSVNGAERKVAALVDKVNVHSYSGLKPWRDNNARRALRESVGQTRLWASEYGDPDGSGMALAQTIVEDINFLRPTAWLYWQPLEPGSAWGPVNGKYGKTDNPNAGEPSWVYYKYYVFAQFTRFLRPGHQIIGSDDHNSIVAYDAAKRQLVIITLNYGNAQPITYDLSGLQEVGVSAAVTMTNSRGPKLFQTSPNSPLKVSDKRLTLDAEANSIYSIVIDGVAL
jgi:galactan endo-1,6-beta-galactosidase